MNNYNKHWKKKTKKKLLAFPNFWVSCHKSFFSPPLQNILCTNRIKISTEVSQMHKYATCSILHILFCFFSPQHSGAELAAPNLHCSHPEDLWIPPTAQLPSSSVLCVYWSKHNESQDGHVEVSCDRLRWYSTGECPTSQYHYYFFKFCCFVFF